MKRIFSTIVVVALTVCVSAQTPQKMSYQAVIRNLSGVLVANQSIGMKISILQGSPTGTLIYQEIYNPNPQTNANGLVTVEIGGGIVLTGTFSTIDWSAGPYFLKTETDPAGGTNYSISGTSQLLSVPYALYTGSSGNGFISAYTTGEKRPVLSMPDGNIGLEVAPDPWIKLNVNGIVNITPGTKSTWGANLGIDASSQAGGVPYTIISTSNGAGEGGGKFLIKNNSESSTFVMDNNGHTGINNLNPAHSLDVIGDINFTGLLLQNGNPFSHTGDVTGSTALTVVGINGTSLAGLATGILKNTTATGVPSIAVAGTDYLAPDGSAALLTNYPTLNQNTTGTASNVTGIVAIANGGTGASNSAAARTNLGLGTLATLNTVGSAQITNGSILGNNIAAGTITSTNLGNSCVTSVNIQDGTITSMDLAVGSVNSATILDGTITTADVGNIDASKISGIGVNYVPRSNGTGLTQGSFIDDGTYCGIGTASTEYKLDVYNTTSGISWAILGETNVSNTANYGVEGKAEAGTLDNYALYGEATGGQFSFGVYALASLGTNNFGVRASANGGTGSYNVGLYANAAGGATNWAGFFDNGDVYITNQIQAPNITSATGTTLVMDASGWIRKLSSDIRLKENITPLNNSLEKVLKLQGVNFTWRSDSTHALDLGFIAQDVQKVLPELVIKDNNNGLLSVKYQNMVAVLAEAIKEQQKQIELAKQENQQLRSELDDLKTLVNTLVVNQTGQGNK
jgi:trimeric autotransporter adhesin